MADKMIRVSGRNPSGVAKALRTDTNGALVFRTQENEVASYVYDQIIDEIGADNISLLLPCWEKTGTVCKDLLDPSMQFDVGASASLGKAGGLHTFVGMDNVSTGQPNGLVQTPFAANKIFQSSPKVPLLTGTKLAQYVTSVTKGDGFIDMAELYISRTGTVSSASFKITLCEDNAGVPGNELTNGTSQTTFTDTVGVGLQWIGCLFSPCVAVPANGGFWVVLEYVSNTGIDASNYLAVACDSVLNTYGGKYAVYNGSTWSVEADKNLCFGLYKQNGIMAGDYTYLFAFRDKTDNWSTPSGNKSQVISQHITRYNTTTIQKHSSGKWLLNFTIGYPVKGNYAYLSAPICYSTDIHIVAVTMSTALAANKWNLYIDGKLRHTINGIAGQYTGPLHTHVEMLLGANVDFGSFLITKNALDGATIAKISHLLRTNAKIEGV